MCQPTPEQGNVNDCLRPERFPRKRFRTGVRLPPPPPSDHPATAICIPKVTLFSGLSGSSHVPPCSDTRNALLKKSDRPEAFARRQLLEIAGTFRLNIFLFRSKKPNAPPMQDAPKSRSQGSSPARPRSISRASPVAGRCPAARVRRQSPAIRGIGEMTSQGAQHRLCFAG